MKKLLAIVMVTIVALSAVSCSKKPPENENLSNSGSSVTVGVGDSDGMIDYANTTEYLGKITTIAGNELDMDLAKLPEVEMPDSVPGGDMEPGTMVAFEMTAAVPAGEAGGGGGAAERIEVEYTGETKSIVIPAGIKVKDPMGNVKALTDIKKGALLSIREDKEGNIVEVVYLG